MPRVRVPLARHALTGALLASVAYLAGGAAAETYHTRHLNSDGTPRYLNALLNEASPYLRQHAYQPIQWQPWAEATLARARRENRLILLSIGYSTCNGCRVMAEESYDDEAVARLLNEHYVAIKVDREEHPDLDAKYMARLELLTPSPGWPINLILTPNAKVVAGGSYLSKEAFIDLLQRYQTAWRERPGAVSRAADGVERHFEPKATEPGALDARQLYRDALTRVRGRYDPHHGGFGNAPKFPNVQALHLLLDSWRRTADPGDRSLFLDSLSAMLESPLYDPVDGGFFRYSVSADWQRPHFEKMLYDQALLAPLLAEAWAISGERRFARATIDTLAFIRQRLVTPSGLYASAMDASTDRREGAFYLWRSAELADDLDPGTQLALDRHFRRVSISPDAFLLAPRGDAEPPSPDLRAKLQRLRGQRPLPFIDTKAITAWNAMMVSALAQGSRLLHRPEWLAEAAGLMRALLRQNQTEGMPRRYSLAGQAYGEASLEDLAYLLAALADLHEMTEDAEWFGEAARIAALAERSSLLPARIPTELARDTLTPAPAAILLDALDRLARCGDDPALQDLARATAEKLGAIPADAMLASLARARHRIAAPLSWRVAYMAAGHIRVEVVTPPDALDRLDFELRLRIAPGWHINDPAPADSRLIPTRIEGVGIDVARLSYPAPNRTSDEGSSPGKAWHEGLVILRGRLAPPKSPTPTAVAISLQPCGPKVCLPPEQARVFFTLPPAELSRPIEN